MKAVKNKMQKNSRSGRWSPNSLRASFKGILPLTSPQDSFELFSVLASFLNYPSEERQSLAQLIKEKVEHKKKKFTLFK